MTVINYFGGERGKNRKRGEEGNIVIGFICNSGVKRKCEICECPKTQCCSYCGAGGFSMQYL